VLRHQSGDGVGEGKKRIVLRHEVGFAVDFHQRAGGTVDESCHHTFGGDAGGRLAGLAAQLDAQDFFCLAHVAAGLGEGLLAFHHRRIGLGPQFGDHACGDCSHACLLRWIRKPSCSPQIVARRQIS
jgi:hypothetical protein